MTDVSIPALRGRAKRRGYYLRKIRLKDKFYLVQMGTGYLPFSEGALTEEEKSISRSEVADFLTLEPLLSEEAR